MEKNVGQRGDEAVGPLGTEEVDDEDDREANRKAHKSREEVGTAIDAGAVGLLRVLVGHVHPDGVGGAAQLVHEDANDAEGHRESNRELWGHAAHDAKRDGDAAGKGGVVGDVATRG